MNMDIFLFTCRFVMISHYYKLWEYDFWDCFIHFLFNHLIFIHFLFSFFLSFPNLLIFDINVFFHGSIHHASTIMSYVSIILAFVTLNIVWRHIIIYFLNISSISPSIYKFMSKFSIIKTITIKEICIPGSELSSLWCIHFELFL